MAGMNATPSGERVHIGFFGRRNAGKSSVVNAVTGQELAVVSDVRGTTTDPVTKAMEILPMGPVVIIDTPGFDDEGSLGELRVRRTRQILNKTDVAVLVVDGTDGIGDCDRELIGLFEEKKIPFIIAFNKSDLTECGTCPQKRQTNCGPASNSSEDSSPENTKAEDDHSGKSDGKVIRISALTGTGINELREMIASMRPSSDGRRLIGDKIKAGDLILLVVPIDKAAPKGRLILPQQQTIRDILDTGAAAVVVRETELAETLGRFRLPPTSAGLSKDSAPVSGSLVSLVITDSQVFGKVDEILPREIPLTSFSILMARYKGLLNAAVKGIEAIDGLRDGDTVLIAEGCTHHRQCGDIGTVKIPKWLSDYTGRKLTYKTVSGTEFPEDLSPYALIIHCGGCMLNEREVTYRTKCAVDQGVPITNYGTMIAFVHGILDRSLEIFSEEL